MLNRGTEFSCDRSTIETPFILVTTKCAETRNRVLLRQPCTIEPPLILVTTNYVEARNRILSHWPGPGSQGPLPGQAPDLLHWSCCLKGKPCACASIELPRALQSLALPRTSVTSSWRHGRGARVASRSSCWRVQSSPAGCPRGTCPSKQPVKAAIGWRGRPLSHRSSSCFRPGLMEAD